MALKVAVIGLVAVLFVLYSDGSPRKDEEGNRTSEVEKAVDHEPLTDDSSSEVQTFGDFNCITMWRHAGLPRIFKYTAIAQLEL